MSDKKDLLNEIASKVKRKKELKEEIASRGENMEAFVMKMINEVEDMLVTSTNPSLSRLLIPLYTKSFESHIQTVDPGAFATIQWADDANNVARINGILIRWSMDYRTKNNCDEELFVDVTGWLLKD